MISELPVIKLPESLSRICLMNLKNTKACHGEIASLVEQDKFLFLFVKQVFSEYSQGAGITSVLNALGWQGFRNRLGEAYLYYARHGSYPKVLVIDEVKYALQLEKRFDFLFSETNSRVFLLGLYLKLCEIDLENSDQYYENSFTGVPNDVDTVLKAGRSKSDLPDWLIVIVWSFYSKFGKDKCLEYFATSKGNIFEIMNQVPKTDYNKFIMDLLVYGHAIYDTEFFTAEKV